MRLCWLALLPLALSCGPYLADAADIATANTKNEKLVKKRAAFELECAADKIKVEPLATHEPPAYQTGLHYQYGVRACDSRAVYVLTPNGWVLNTEAERPKDTEASSAVSED